MNPRELVGIGLRRALARDLLETHLERPAFLEVAPENWMNIGGQWGETFRRLSEQYQLAAHGLSLSLGGPDPLDRKLLGAIKTFLDCHKIRDFSEHLSFCQCENAHLYDLLPMPFCDEAVKHVAERIRMVQDLLERRIAIENVSYYLTVAADMSEAQFLRAVLEEADCDLLLDVNNCFVNATNHNYDVYQFLDDIPLERVVAIHMAGHEQRYPDLIIDTHGHPIIDPVFDLLEFVLWRVPPVRVVLERDFNVKSLSDIAGELDRLRELCSLAWDEVKLTASGVSL